MEGHLRTSSTNKAGSWCEVKPNKHFESHHLNENAKSYCLNKSMLTKHKEVFSQSV